MTMSWLISKRWCWVTEGRGDKYRLSRAAPREQQLSAPWTASRPPVWLQSACEQRQTPGGVAKKQHGKSATQILHGRQMLLGKFFPSIPPLPQKPIKKTAHSPAALARQWQILLERNTQRQRERERNKERSGAEGFKDMKNTTSFTTRWRFPSFFTSSGSVAALSWRFVCCLFVNMKITTTTFCS